MHILSASLRAGEGKTPNLHRAPECLHPHYNSESRLTRLMRQVENPQHPTARNAKKYALLIPK